jgi:hypothetical protein
MNRRSVLIAQLLILLTSTFLSHNTVMSQAITGMDVMINEFDSNPPSGPQWIELYNPTDFTSSISLWKIITRAYGITYTIPGGSSIPGKGYFYLEFTFPIIDPEGDVVFLQDNNGLEIDRTPPLSKPVKDNTGWARVPNGADTDSPNDWKLQAATKGASNDVTLPPPPPVVPTIACTLSSPQIDIGRTVTITVIIGPARVAPVTIQTKRLEDASWSNLTTAATDGFGRFEQGWTVNVLGAYNVRAYVYPSNSFSEMYSFPEFLSVTKIRMQLSCSVRRPVMELGQVMATFGYLIPAIEGASISLTYRKPTGPPITRNVQTGSGGLFNDTAFTPQEAGSWNVTASWEGDETHMSAMSPMAYFTVLQPPTQFGMWMVIGLVLGISISAILLAAGLTTKARQKPPRRVAVCPVCRSVLAYVPSARSWYCYRCRRYIQ